MTTGRLMFTAVTLNLLLGCPGPGHPTIQRFDDTQSCAAACKKMGSLLRGDGRIGCEEAENLEDGTTCTKFCEDSQNSGHSLRPSCILEKVQKCLDIQPMCFGK